MAVNLTPKSTRLQLKYAGAVVDGKETIVSKTYSKVKAAATEQDLFDTAQAIASLQTLSVHGFNKLVDSEMNEMA